MSHNGYIQGLLENGCQVDILMSSDSWGANDARLPVWEDADYYCYTSISLHDRLRNRFRGLLPAPTPIVSPSPDTDTQNHTTSIHLKTRFRAVVKQLYYSAFPNDPLYPLEHTWIKRAMRFHNDIPYDLVISNSSPAASHRVAWQLIEKKRIACSRWVQIWEDPWATDLYSSHSKTIYNAESALLQEANEIYYVSPLTLTYQQQLFPACAHKMKHLPLPYLCFTHETVQPAGSCSFGYFGDYFSNVRNLKPFYLALLQSGVRGFIYGDTNESLVSTEAIEIGRRVTLERLERIQAKSHVLVQLCNLHGGQIPGKIYHYSATRKPILFILDGTPEEQSAIYRYFAPFDRYYFCENKTLSILAAMQTIQAELAAGKTWEPVSAFAPKEVVSRLL